MRRREFIALAGSVTALPFAARAQQPLPVVGILNARSAEDTLQDIAALRSGLQESGFAEGRSVTFLSRFADGHYDRLPALADDLVRNRVSVIAAGGGASATIAAKAVTSTIPIVFTSGNDPVTMGLVGGLNRPGGNVTGVYIVTSALDAKRFQILCEVVPGAEIVAVLLNSTNPTFQRQVEELQAAARTLHKKLLMLTAQNERDIETAFSAISQQHVTALLVASDPYLSESRSILTLSARHRLATAYLWRRSVEAGGLLSYGTSLPESYRLAGMYIGRILKGAKPSDLPVQQSSKVDLVINLKTAKSLGLSLPQTLLGRADEVIE